MQAGFPLPEPAGLDRIGELLTSSAKKISVCLTPLLVLLAAYFAFPHLAELSPPRRELLLMSPYLTAMAGMFLAVHFHRGRPFWALFLITFSYWLQRTYLPEGINGVAGQAVFQAIALFVPLNLAALAFLRERGIFSPSGQVRLAVFVLEAGMVYMAFKYDFVELQPLLDRSYIQLPFEDRLATSQLTLFATLLSFAATAILAAMRKAPLDIGIAGAIVAFFIAWNWLSVPLATVAFSSAGSLIIMLAILQDSYNMAFRDDLTGIPSRRALNERLNGIGRRYAVAMADIDHFKSFNDTYGHDVGDQVLRMVARKLATVGGGGEAYRYGGEEFTILFPNKGIQEVQQHLEEIRETIANYPMQIRGADRPANSYKGNTRTRTPKKEQAVQVTVSIGVAECGGGKTRPETVIKAADKALYKAKHGGRNRVCAG